MMKHRGLGLRLPAARHWMVLAYVVTVIGLVAYINLSRSQTLGCVYDALAQTNRVTATRTEAANAQDRATLERIEAMDRIVQLRIPDPTRHDATIEELRQKHHDATMREARELRRVLAVRKAAQPPNIRKVC